MTRSPALAAAVAAVAITLTACSGSEGNGAYGSASGGAAPKTITPPPGIILSANSTADLGTVVIDGLGFTLYRYEGDSADPSKATCEGACTEQWEPMLSSEPVVLEGVQEGEVGSVQRPDGKPQVTIGGWPIYRYKGDPQPGAVEGHGEGGKWFAITPDGDKADKA